MGSYHKLVHKPFLRRAIGCPYAPLHDTPVIVTPARRNASRWQTFAIRRAINIIAMVGFVTRIRQTCH
jgi:hypothetical protein